MNAIALTCMGALGLLLFGLGFAVSMARQRSGVLNGAQGADQLLTKLVRAHGNAAEYVPFLAVLFLYLGAHDPSTWVVGCMVGATVCRLVHALSLTAWPSMTAPNPARAVGAVGTYLFGIALCVALLIGH